MEETSFEIHHFPPKFVAVFSTLLFMSMVLVYKSLGKDIRKMYNCDWQTGGVLAGWIVIALGIGQTLLFYAQRAESDFYYYGTILYIGKFGAGLILMKMKKTTLREQLAT